MGAGSPFWANRDVLWPFLLSGLFCLLVYLPASTTPYRWDDVVYIEQNQALGGPAGAAEFFSPKYFSFSREGSWRPLATFSYHASIRLFGRSPVPQRLAGLFLHLLNAFLLFALTRRLGIAPLVGAWASALFLVHPAHTETLMCVTFNEELLTAFGLLTLLWAHMERRVGWGAVGLAAALLSKETGALGIVLALMCDYAVGGAGRVRKNRGAYGVYAAVLGAYVWMRFFVLPGPGAQGGVSSALPYYERALYGLQGYVTALRVFVFPVNLRIEYFALPPVSAVEGLAWAAGGAGLMVLGWALYRRYKKDRVMTLFLAWPILFLAVTSNLIPFNLLSLRYMAERWLYLPYLGAAVVLAAGLVKHPKAAACLLVAWGVSSAARVGDWRDDNRLWGSLTRVYPWSAKAWEGRGEAYYRSGRYPESLAAFLNARDLRWTKQDRVLARYVPISGGVLRWQSPSLHRWLGRAYLKEGDLDGADESFMTALELDAGSGYSYRIMAYHYVLAGRPEDARRWYVRGLRRFPEDQMLRRLKKDAAAGRLSFRAVF